MLLKQANEVKGFNELTEQQQKLFISMLRRFYSGWEFPENWQPVKVSYVLKGNYLRVDFKGKRWLHFLQNGTWY